MGSKTLPEQLKTALEYHVAESDLREEKEMLELLTRLSELSRKVNKAKEKALAKRQMRQL